MDELSQEITPEVESELSESEEVSGEPEETESSEQEIEETPAEGEDHSVAEAPAAPPALSYEKIFQMARAGDPVAIRALQTYIPGLNASTETKSIEEKDAAPSYGDIETTDDLMAAVSKMIKSELSPLYQSINEYKQKTVAQKLREEHPDFDSHIPEMRSILQRTPGLPLEDAYKIAAFGAQKKPVLRDVSKAKKVNNVLRPSTPKAKTQPIAPKFKNFAEAFEFTKKMANQ